MPDATVGQIAMSWLALAATTILATIVMSSERMVILIGALATGFVLPFPIALSAVGAAIARPRIATPDLPDAVARPGR
ncbi:MAG: hypothetical protein IPL61_22685 [Myxococcales bacterium]|nr:hypothetical protein [Myxococcales bacterium]